MTINSRTIRGHPEMKETYNKFARKCDIIMSAPGTFFLAGEKAIAHGAPATCMKIPRRVYVGLKKQNDSMPARIHWDSTEVMIQESEILPLKSDSWDGERPDFKRALVAASIAYHVLTGTTLSTSYQLNVLSEWGGGSGLGWSGAFSVALAGALLMSENKIDDPKGWPIYDPVQLSRHSQFNAVMRLGWCIESVLHGGRASGSAVCGSLLGTGLPYLYRIIGDPRENMPALWKTTVEDVERDELCNDPSIYTKLIERGKYEFDYLLSSTDYAPPSNIKSRIHKDLFATKDIVIINSGIPKKTAKQAKYELDPNHWSNQKKFGKKRGYQVLVNTCKYIGETTRRIMKALEDDRLDELNNQWDVLCQSMTRCQGILTFLGFNFPVGDEILNVVTSEVCETLSEVCEVVDGKLDKQRAKSIGGKLTGGGGGGSLILVARVSTTKQLHYVMEKTITKLRDNYTKRNPPLTHTCILYSAHRDEMEWQGLIRELTLETKITKPFDDGRQWFETKT